MCNHQQQQLWQLQQQRTWTISLWHRAAKRNKLPFRFQLNLKFSRAGSALIHTHGSHYANYARTLCLLWTEGLCHLITLSSSSCNGTDTIFLSYNVYSIISLDRGRISHRWSFLLLFLSLLFLARTNSICLARLIYPFLVAVCVCVFVCSFACNGSLLTRAIIVVVLASGFRWHCCVDRCCRNYLRSGWILNSHGLIYAAITYRAPTNQTSERREKKTLSSISDARYKRVWRLVDDQHENSFLTALIRCSFSGLYRAFRFHHDDI